MLSIHRVCCAACALVSCAEVSMAQEYPDASGAPDCPVQRGGQLRSYCAGPRAETRRGSGSR